VFTVEGRQIAKARTLKEFAGLLAALPADRIIGHLRRHDFSRWIEDVFRDGPLASRVHDLEMHADADDIRDLTEGITQAIRARYETAGGIAELASR